jgi:hypothetical protein
MTTPEVKTPTGFADIGVPERIDAGLAAAGFSAPFAIQTEAIPVAMAGEDVMGRARTGSGKTLAFGVPMMARIDAPATPGKPHGLVIVAGVGSVGADWQALRSASAGCVRRRRQAKTSRRDREGCRDHCCDTAAPNRPHEVFGM